MYDREEPQAKENVPQSIRDIERIRAANQTAAAGEASTRGGYGDGRLSYATEHAGPVNALRPANFGLEGYSSQELSLDNIVDAFTYQPMHSGQIENAEQVREVLIAAAKVILRTVPRSPRRTLALQHLVNARMDANCAISFGGRF